MERLLLPLLVWISVGLYLTEVALGTADSRHGPVVFLWAERVIAVIFMVEWLVRRGKLTLLGWIDFIAWFPFLVGFFVPVAWLGTIRALRILRLLKLFRYSASMRSVARAFHRAWPRLRPLVMCLGIIGLFNTVIMTEVEGWSLGDSAWYVLVSATTVGYGDLSPGTPTGKLLAAFTLLVPTLALYAGMLGIIGSSLSEVDPEPPKRTSTWKIKFVKSDPDGHDFPISTSGDLYGRCRRCGNSWNHVQACRALNEPTPCERDS